MHPKKRRRVSPESRRDGEKYQGPVIKVVWVNDGLSRALRLFKVRILLYNFDHMFIILEKKLGQDGR